MFTLHIYTRLLLENMIAIYFKILSCLAFAL